jgi:putative MFS transporter
LLASAGVPALIVLVLRMGTPESPRWLHGKGRIAEAKAVLLKHFGPNVTLDGSGADHHSNVPGGFARLFKKDLIHRTFFNCAFFVCLVIPYFAVYTFLPTILKAIHLNDGSGADFLLNGFLVVRGDMPVAGGAESAAGVIDDCDDRGVRDLHVDHVGFLESGGCVSAGVFSH